MQPVPSPPAWHDEIRSVGVTGTNGKTTTTSWIAAALGTLGSPVTCVTTLGFRRGEIALEVAKDHASFVAAMRESIDAGSKHAAIEFTSEALAAGFARAWPCRVGVFTNLSHDHIDTHGSFEHYLASKAQLFVVIEPGGVAVLNGCDAVYQLLREIVPSGVRVLTYGVASRGEKLGALDLEVTNVRVSRSETELTCEGHALGRTRKFAVRGIGEIYGENAAAALLGSIAMGVSIDDAIDAISRAPAPPGRFEIVRDEPCVVVDYAHTPDALARTCGAARALADASHGELVVVFGAGGHRDRTKRAPMGHAARIADRIILTSDNPRDEDPREIAGAIAEGLAGHPRVEIEIDRATAIRRAIDGARPHDVVLIAGKGHETEQHLGDRIVHFSDAELARLK
jgi:UDP-N-acetylmuramoyl-L-alanyl-D-glutamate--2,6-diaminopimelate ligase